MFDLDCYTKDTFFVSGKKEEEYPMKYSLREKSITTPWTDVHVGRLKGQVMSPLYQLGCHVYNPMSSYHRLGRFPYQEENAYDMNQ